MTVNQIDERILITVEDKGTGFHPGQLRAKGGKAGGMGLFSISERLSHVGGRLRVESAPGRGSRFRLSVPISSASLGDESAGEPIQVSVAVPIQKQTPESGPKKNTTLVG